MYTEIAVSFIYNTIHFYQYLFSTYFKGMATCTMWLPDLETLVQRQAVLGQHNTRVTQLHYKTGPPDTTTCISYYTTTY